MRGEPRGGGEGELEVMGLRFKNTRKTPESRVSPRLEARLLVR